MNETTSRGSGVPASLRWAAIALVAYGIVVVASATVLQAMNDWVAIAEYPRALLRGLGVAITAWGLLRRARWAWWLGIVLVSVWLATSVFALLMLFSVGMAEVADQLPPGFYPVMWTTLALLAAAAAMLLSPSSRAAVR
jgi:hypothetical protein